MTTKFTVYGEAKQKKKKSHCVCGDMVTRVAAYRRDATTVTVYEDTETKVTVEKQSDESHCL